MGKKQTKARWLDRALYHILSRLFLLLGRISPQRAAKIGDVIGRLWFALDKRHRKVAIDNLAMVYGDRMSSAAMRGFARQVFCNLARIVFEIGWSLHIDNVRNQKHFRFYGMHHLRSAQKKGKGVLVLTAHLGNWEFLLVAAAIMNMKFSAVYRPLDFKPLDMFFEDIRNTTGTKLHQKKGAMFKVLRSLANNEGVGILLDQKTKPSSGVLVDFLGRPAYTNMGLAILAKRSRAPVIPVFAVREDGCYSVRILPEVPFIDTGDDALDMIENTRLYNRAIESMITQYPEQWFWLHRRWEIRPVKRKNTVTAKKTVS